MMLSTISAARLLRRRLRYVDGQSQQPLTAPRCGIVSTPGGPPGRAALALAVPITDLEHLPLLACAARLIGFLDKRLGVRIG